MAPGDRQTQPDASGLSAEEVGARVGSILDSAEREAREIIDAARREVPGEPSASQGSPGDDAASAIERLSLRFDAFELSTTAQIEELRRELRAALPASANGSPAPVAPEPVAEEPPALEESPEVAAARIRAIDLALAGYSRDRIANELSASMDRSDVELLLDHVLIS